MTIHYQNYQRFSAGQGFAGVLCRGLGASVDSKRWVAVDCQACREKVIGVEVISSRGRRGYIESVSARVVVVNVGDYSLNVPWGTLDKDWAPLSVALKAVFGDE